MNRINIMRRVFSLLLVFVFVVNDANQLGAVGDTQPAAQESPNQSSVVISDYELSLNVDTSEYDTYTLVREQFPYLEPDYDYLVAISDMQLLNMSFVLSILDVLNRQKSTTNILNLAVDEVFPDPAIFECTSPETSHDDHLHDEGKPVHTDMPNVCNSQVTHTSDNVDQYMALAVTLNTLRQQHAQQRLAAPEISARSEAPTIATLAVNDVAQMVIGKQDNLVQSRTDIMQHIHNRYVSLVPQSQQKVAQRVSARVLTNDEQVRLLNSLQLQFPWALGKEQCITEGGIHAFNPKAKSGTSSFDFLKCDDTEELFTVHAMLDGKPITNLQSTNAGDSRDVVECDNRFITETKVGDTSIVIAYLHLESTLSLYDSTDPNYISEVKKNDPIIKIAKSSEQQNICAFSTAPHVHVSIFINGLEVTANYTGANGQVSPSWSIGGWRLQFKKVVDGSAWRGGLWNSYYAGHGNFFNFVNIKDSTVTSDQTKTTAKLLNVPMQYTPDRKFTLRQTSATTTNGRWPSLSWNYSGPRPRAYYLEVTQQDDTYWLNPAVYECVQPSDNWLGIFTQNTSYRPTSVDFQTQRTGVFKWRVRTSDVAATDAQCVDKNRGKWDNWSVERVFTNRALHNQSPVDRAVGFFQTFRWSDLGSVWNSPGRSIPAVRGYQLKIGRAGNATPIIVQCSARPSLIVPLDQMAKVSGLSWYTVSVLTQPFTSRTCASLTGIYESYPRFFENRIALAQLTPVLPVEGHTTTNGLWPQLTWQPPEGASATFGYRIQVSRVANFASMEVDECTSTPSYIPRDNWWAQARTGTFYWRVNYVPSAWGSNQAECKNLTVNSATWSAPRTFINPPSGAAPQLSSPANAVTSVDGLWPAMSWSAGNADLAVHGYRIQVSNEANFTPLIVDECRTSTSYRPTSDGWMRSKNGTYYWRINYVKSAWNNSQSACKAQAVEGGLWSAVRTFVNQQPTNPVVHTAPANGVVSSDGGWPRLEWTNGNYMSAPHGYRIQVSTSNTFTAASLVVDECTATQNYQPKDSWWAQAKTGTYYWRVNYVPGTWGTNQNTCKGLAYRLPWSTPQSFINPVSNKAPQLTTPATGFVSPDGLWPALAWNPAIASFATHGYRVQVSTSNSFSSFIVDECLMGTSYRPTSNSWMRSQNGTYYWRINYVKNAWSGNQAACKAQAVENSLWSEVRSFVNQQPANPVVHTAPADAAVSSDGGWPRLEWTNGNYMSAPHGYRIQVSTSSSFSSTVVDECTNATSYQPVDFWWAQTKTGTYYWRVNYVPGTWGTNQSTCKGLTYRLPWSTPRSFINPVSNKAPQLTAPATGFVSPDGLWPAFGWNPAIASFATHGYRIQISTSTNFNSFIVDECLTGTTYRPTSDSWMRSQNGTYHWRINYVKNAWSGNQTACKAQAVENGLWSEVRSFVNQQPANPVVRTSPSNGSVSSDGAWPRLEWTNGNYMSAPNGYRIQVSTSSNFSSTVVDECTTGTSYQPTDFWWAQSQRGTFYWRVNYVPATWGTNQSTCKSLTYSSRTWSSSGSFANPSSQRSPIPIAPSDGHTTSDGLWPALSWSAFSGSYATYGYRIQVGTSNTFGATSLVVDECTTSTSYRPSSDSWMRERNLTYYWRVNYVKNAWNGSQSACKSQTPDATLWSSARRFNNPTPSNPVVIVSPSSGSSSGDGGWPRLSWTNGNYMSAPYGYRLQVSTSSSFSSTVVDECTTGTSYQPSDFWWAQSQRGTFYWRVNYVPNSWSSQSGCKSQTYNTSLWGSSVFTNPTSLNRSPRLSSPSSGHTTSDGLWPTISWSAFSSGYGQYNYRIQISSSSSFSSPAVDECRSSTSYRPNSDSWMRERVGTWYWRINYCHSSGTNNSLWSEIRSFNNPRPQNKVVAQSPSNNHTTSNMLWPTLSWSAGSHMTNYYKYGYRILVWKNTSSGWVNLVDECTTGTSYKPSSDSWMRSHTGTLQWRIFYVESAWNGSQSSCKAQGVVASLGSDARIFYNPIR